MADDALLKDLQEIACDAALLVEGKDLKHLTTLEQRLVALLTKRGFLTKENNGFVGKARCTDHK